MDSNGARRLEITGTVVGLIPDEIYEEKSVELPPGTVLAIYTDGITEAVNKEDEEFGEKRLLEALRQSYSSPPQAIWDYVMAGVAAWQNELPQFDDITLIVAKTGQQAKPPSIASYPFSVQED
jgi:phosphoserine phosphatase RsbU/P